MAQLNERFVDAINKDDEREVATILAEQPALANAIDPRFNAPVLFGQTNPYIVRHLIRYGADINAWSDGMTPLLLAAFNGDTDVAKTLIELGANVNETSYSGGTALVYAIESCKKELIDTLLASGAEYGLKPAVMRHDIARVTEILGEAPSRVLQEFTDKAKKGLLEVSSKFFSPEFGGLGTNADWLSISAILLRNLKVPENVLKEVASHADDEFVDLMHTIIY